MKTISERKREQGNLVISGSFESADKTNADAIAGKAPLHLLCEFIGAATPHILTVACLIFQKRDNMKAKNKQDGTEKVESTSSHSKPTYGQFVHCISKTFTTSVQALLNVGALPNQRTSDGRSACELLMTSAIDSVASLRFTMAKSRILPQMYSLW